MDFMERLFSQAPGRFHSDPLDSHSEPQFVAPMEAEPRRAAAAFTGEPSVPRASTAGDTLPADLGELRLKSCSPSAEIPTASKPLEDYEMDLGNEGYPFSTEDTEERYGR